MPKLVPFTYQEALTLNFICVAYDFAALLVCVYVQFNDMGKRLNECKSDLTLN